MAQGPHDRCGPRFPSGHKRLAPLPSTVWGRSPGVRLVSIHGATPAESYTKNDRLRSTMSYGPHHKAFRTFVTHKALSDGATVECEWTKPTGATESRWAKIRRVWGVGQRAAGFAEAWRI